MEKANSKGVFLTVLFAVGVPIFLVFMLLFMTGCGSVGSKPTTRFVEEPSGGFPFSLYRDTKTKRLYSFTQHGGLREINDVPSVYETAPEPPKVEVEK